MPQMRQGWSAGGRDDQSRCMPLMVWKCAPLFCISVQEKVYAVALAHIRQHFRITVDPEQKMSLQSPCSALGNIRHGYTTVGQNENLRYCRAFFPERGQGLVQGFLGGTGLFDEHALEPLRGKFRNRTDRGAP